MDGVARKAYKKDESNGGRKRHYFREVGRPPGPHHKTALRDQIVQDCRELVKKNALNATRAILEEEAKLAFSDIRQAFDDNGDYLPPQLLPDEIAAAVKSVRRIEKTIPVRDAEPIVVVSYEYTFWDKPSALERLSKHFGLYKADNQQKPGTRINTQINLNLADFSDDELRMLVNIGGKLDGAMVSLPEPEIIEIEPEDANPDGTT